MNKAIKYYAITAVLLLAILYFSFRGKAGDYGKSYSFAVFNTGCSLFLWGADEAALDNAFREVLVKLQALHNTINAYDKDSELSRLNEAAYKEAFVCSEELWNVIAASRKAWQVTDGAFDPTVGVAMRLWGFHKKKETLPTQEELASVLDKVGLSKVLFDDAARSLRFTVDGMALDFGGIAKGYAADLAKSILDKHGIEIYMIDLGGNLLLSEKTPNGETAFKVSIRSPEDKNAAAKVLMLKGCAVATSGNYERSRMIQGRRIGHIMDPLTCMPVQQFASVTAMTRCGVDSDVFSTAVFARGRELAEKLRKSVPGTDFVMLE